MAIWREYFENAYIGSFHYLVNKKLHWTERIFWLITIVASIGGTYYIISRSVFEFKEQKAMYKVDTNYLTWRTPFPSVVICERKYAGMPTKLKRVVKKILEGYGFNDSMIGEDLKSKLGDFAFIRPSEMQQLKDYCGRSPCPSGNYSSVMYQLRSKCSDLMSYCAYNDKVFECCEEFLPVLTAFGNCFAFNNYGGRRADGSRVQTLKWNIVRKPDVSHGSLYIELKYRLLIINVVAPSELPHVQNENTIFKETQTTTLSEDVHYHYQVNVIETVTLDDQKSISMETRGCRFPYENNLKYFDFYSESNCVLECFMRAQKDLCGCILHTYPMTNTSKHCQLNNIFCTFGVSDLDCHCAPDCNSTNIQKVGVTEKPAKGNFKGELTKVSFRLEVPAPVLRYMRYSLKSQLSLIVSLGGTVGFFLGFSFLSIAQAVYYFFIRSLSDYLVLKRNRKLEEKEEQMRENFQVARMRLKLGKVEREIKKEMWEKIQEIDRGT